MHVDELKREIIIVIDKTVSGYRDLVTFFRD